MHESGEKLSWQNVLPSIVTATLVTAAIVGVTCVAPTEATMGHAQRILYIHVCVAWLSLLALAIMAVTGIAYLTHRDLRWDHWAHAAAELGWLSCGLTLVTGSLWAHFAWGTWWTWEPRLTTAFILWMIYSGCLILRGSLPDPHRRARMAAVLAILGVLDIPLVVMSTRWFRGIHPASPQMKPSMRVVLALTIVGFAAFFLTLVIRRRAQLHLEYQLGVIRQRAEG